MAHRPKTHYSGIMEASEAARIFGALAQESRLGVLRLLIAEGPNGLSCRRFGGPAGDAGIDDIVPFECVGTCRV